MKPNPLFEQPHTDQVTAGAAPATETPLQAGTVPVSAFRPRNPKPDSVPPATERQLESTAADADGVAPEPLTQEEWDSLPPYDWGW
jgi:hypothetical protein